MYSVTPFRPPLFFPLLRTYVSYYNPKPILSYTQCPAVDDLPTLLSPRFLLFSPSCKYYRGSEASLALFVNPVYWSFHSIFAWKTWIESFLLPLATIVFLSSLDRPLLAGPFVHLGEPAESRFFFPSLSFYALSRGRPGSPRPFFNSRMIFSLPRWIRCEGLQQS